MKKKGPLPMATTDHIVPKSKGGSLKKRNLVLSCGPCNWGKGSEFKLRQFSTKSGAPLHIPKASR